jgi:hypothetical protein
MKFKRFPLTVLALCLVLTACSHPKLGTTEVAIQSPISAAASPIPHTVPSLIVNSNCNRCEISPEVQKSILDTYQLAASKSGLQIDPTQRATLTITSYSSRGTASKLLLGPFAIAMTDEIKATVSTGSSQFLVEESTCLPFRSINSVAQVIGQATFHGMNELK